MAEPIFTDATERAYAALPAVHREEDRLQPDPVAGYPLKRWLSGLGDQVGEVDELIARIDFETPDAMEYPEQAVSELADPDLADAAWLPWLAQLLGVRRGTLTDAGLRDAIRGAVSGFRAGTKGAIAAAASTVLTGTRAVAVYDHSISDPGDGGGEWDVLIVTRASETPGGAASVLNAVAAANAKPAGVILRHAGTDVQWSVLIANRPTWAAWNGKTRTQIVETGM
jgi:hypothetical protein